MRALFANYAHIMHTFSALYYTQLAINNEKRPSKSTPVTESDYSANLESTFMFKKTNYSSKIVLTLGPWPGPWA